MRVLAVLPQDAAFLPSLAEALLLLSPQVALGEEAVFAEVGASRSLFSEEECVRKAAEILQAFGQRGRIALGPDPATALAFARYGVREKEALPVAALADYLSPFSRQPFPALRIFQKLGVESLGDFLTVPRKDLASRFGREGVEAYENLLRAGRVAWPRFTPPETLEERLDFDFAARIENLEPVLFLLKQLLHRIFHRLHGRGEKLVGLDLTFHLNRFSKKSRRVEVRLPLPQGNAAALLALLRERLEREFARRPLEEALEGVSALVQETAPFLEVQRELFSRAEEEKEAWSSLAARFEEKMGQGASFLAVPQARLLPEASWRKALEWEEGEVVPAPERPLRLLRAPLPLRREKDRLKGRGMSWRILKVEGPEKLSGEWWRGGFQREYFRVETENELLWVFRSAEGLFLHGIFD